MQANQSAQHHYNYMRPLFGTVVFPTAMPQRVYHYTTIEGLQGILEQKALWATDLSFMNDTSEYDYATALINSELTFLEAAHQNTPTDPRREPPLQFYRRSINSRASRTFAACFCETNNLLSQWRGYCKNGTGYAIEFDWGYFIDPANPATRHLAPGRIEYEEVAQRELIGRTLRSQLSPFLGSSPTDPCLPEVGPQPIHSGQARAQNDLVLPLDALAMGLLRAFLKSRDFSEEKEWRVASTAGLGDRGEAFRPASGILVPFRKIPLDALGSLPITKITVGPGPHPNRAKQGLERYLAELKLSHIEVAGSDTPVII